MILTSSGSTGLKLYINPAPMLLPIWGLRTALDDGIHWKEKGKAVFGIHSSPSAFGQSSIIQVALQAKNAGKYATCLCI